MAKSKQKSKNKGKGKGKDEGQAPDAPDTEAQEPEVEVDPLTRAEAERDEYLESWRRAQADYQNLRRRTLADIDNALRRDRTQLLGEVLTVLDYLDMALLSPCESPDAQALKMGVQLTRDQLWKLLEDQGVRPIPAADEFDPECHQAVATVEDEGEPGRVLEVQRAGYRLQEDILRHAQVKVSALPADPEVEAATEGEIEADGPGDESAGEEA